MSHIYKKEEILYRDIFRIATQFFPWQIPVDLTFTNKMRVNTSITHVMPNYQKQRAIHLLICLYKISILRMPITGRAWREHKAYFRRVASWMGIKTPDLRYLYILLPAYAIFFWLWFWIVFVCCARKENPKIKLIFFIYSYYSWGFLQYVCWRCTYDMFYTTFATGFHKTGTPDVELRELARFCHY